MIPRDALTKIFLQQWGKSIDEANFKIFSRKWWQSTRTGKQTAFRLSDEGFEFLETELELQCYEIPFTQPIELSPQTIVFLERYIDCPYYLTKESITVFSERKIVFFSEKIAIFWEKTHVFGFSARNRKFCMC
jgi:hypothetical protein